MVEMRGQLERHVFLYIEGEAKHYVENGSRTSLPDGGGAEPKPSNPIF